MHAIKDIVYERLSRFFSDSQTPDEELDRPSEARSNDTDEKSSTSMLSYVLNAATFDWFRQTDPSKSDESHSFKWGSKRYSWKEKPLEMYQECDIEFTTIDKMVDGELDSSTNHLDKGESGTSSFSDVYEDARTLNSFEKSICTLKADSVFITESLYQFFEASLPNIVKGCQWVLLYSTARHGISLQTLFRRSCSLSGPCLLITGDKQGAVFGGLIECPLQPTPKRKYQGTNQSFVFSTVYGEPRIFRPTGANRYFCLCLNELLALGGGGNFALCLNEDLLSGSSGACETFGNLCLAHDQDFQVKDVELWGFAHLSQYV